MEEAQVTLLVDALLSGAKKWLTAILSDPENEITKALAPVLNPSATAVNSIVLDKLRKIKEVMDEASEQASDARSKAEDISSNVSDASSAISEASSNVDDIDTDDVEECAKEAERLVDDAKDSLESIISDLEEKVEKDTVGSNANE